MSSPCWWQLFFSPHLHSAMYAFGFGPTLVAYMLPASTDDPGVSSAIHRLLWGSSEIGPTRQDYFFSVPGGIRYGVHQAAHPLRGQILESTRFWGPPCGLSLEGSP